MAQLRGWIGLVGLALVATPLASQSLWLPASDPVGIARSGAGIAYGRSLEAASLNPALLATLPDRRGAFLGVGMEMVSGQFTLQSNDRSLFTSDRNRFLPAFGMNWGLNDRWTLGMKVDTPFARHGRFPSESGARFSGTALDLKAQRMEFQAAWAFRPDLSFGMGLGVARLSLEQEVALRVPVPDDPTQPLGEGNPSQGLMEQGIGQRGSKTVLSYSAGFRWALTTRWTVAATYQGPLRGTLASSGYWAGPSRYVANDGFGTAIDPEGIRADGETLLANSRVIPGGREMRLPSRLSVGARQRVNQLFTWELDLRYVGASRLDFGGLPSISTPSGTSVSPQSSFGARSGFGASLMGEVSVGKRWTLRGGASLDPAFLRDEAASPLLLGGQSAAYSVGAGVRLLGGELNAGYQFRQQRDIDTNQLDGTWTLGGFRPSGTKGRVEGTGHLWSLGFRRSF